jgi:lysine 2,3-aminomutase
MAGKNKSGVFNEKITSFLMEKLEQIKQLKGENSKEYNAIYLQYKKLPLEDEVEVEANERHWEADLNMEGSLSGLERLYRRSLVIEPTLVCAAHCRYCLRANYSMFTLTPEEITRIAKFCGSPGIREQVNEVLITGGDPFLVPNQLDFLFEGFIEYAPNIKIIRIGTRLPIHNPLRIDDTIFSIFTKYMDKVRFEVATQINHPADLFPETLDVFRQFRNMGITVYSQNVLLKGINDDLETLVELYDSLRQNDIEAHYLFHCVPMRGMHHFRTSVGKGLELAKQLTNGGLVSGRCKPMYALMTDIGKITLYEGTILKKDEEKNSIYLQSFYKYTDRLESNPNWKLPENAEVDKNGYLRIWYLDGKDD